MPESVTAPPPAASNGETKMSLASIMSEAAGEELAPPDKKGQAPPPAAAPDEPPSDPPVEETPPADEPPVEGEETPPAPAASDDKAGRRDYSKFDAEDQPFLKQMSRPAFEHFSKKLEAGKSAIAERDGRIVELQKAVSETKGEKLPDAWYNAPEAFKASPKYKEAATAFHEAQAKTFEWSEILSGLDAGALKYDAASRNFVPVTEAEREDYVADPRVKRWVEDQRFAELEKQKEHAAAANNIEREFKSVHQTAEKIVDEGIGKFFPWRKDAKDERNKSFQQIHNEWPEVKRGDKVTEFASALAVQYITLERNFKTLQDENKALKQLKTDVRRSGPIPGRGAKAALAEEEKPWSKDDFESGKVFAARA